MVLFELLPSVHHVSLRELSFGGSLGRLESRFKVWVTLLSALIDLLRENGMVLMFCGVDVEPL
jgi:hypothetical protein